MSSMEDIKKRNKEHSSGKGKEGKKVKNRPCEPKCLQGLFAFVE